MRSGFQGTNLLLLESIGELVANEDLALAFRDEVDVVVLRGYRVVLLTENVLRSIKHGVHSFNDIIDDILVETTVQGFRFSEEMLRDLVGLDCALENLD